MIEMTALAFLLMGSVALVSPHSITRWVAITALPVPARNEVRAVYGGYGVAMAVLLIVCRDHPLWRDGVVLTVSLALLGMAVGRLLSWLVDRRLDRYPALFMGTEVVLGVGLLIAL